MKKLITLGLFVAFVSVQNLYSQDKGRSYISINGGLSLPLGAYSESSFKTDKHYGFADPGSNISIESRINIFKRFGVGIYLGIPFHKLDSEPIEENVRTTQSYPSPQYNVEASTQSGSFGGGSALAGLSYSLPVNNFAFDFKILGGVSSWSKDIDIEVRDKNDNNRVVYTESYSFDKDFWPTLQVGAAARWNANGRFGLKLGIDYNKVLKSDLARGTNVRTYDSGSGTYVNSLSINELVKSPISYLNLELGVVLHFGQNSK